MKKILLLFTCNLGLNLHMVAQFDRVLSYYDQICLGYDSLFEKEGATPVSVEMLRGSWKCFDSEYYDGMIAREDVGPYHFPAPETIIFSADEISEFNYPCEWVGNVAYKLKGDSILIASANQTEEVYMHMISSVRNYRMNLRNDTLILYRRQSSSYVLRRFVRQKPDSKTIEVLLQKKINPDCLKGEWKLETEYDSGYDGNGVVPIEYPVALPQKVNFNAEKIKQRLYGRTLWLPVGGKLKAFYIVTFSEYKNSFTLVPGRWWQKGEFKIVYNLQDAEEE